MQWRCRHRVIDLTRPGVVGILNVTPDSFSDGNRYASVEAAGERAKVIAAEGTEIARTVPVIEAIAAASDIAISIDTSKPAVMAAAAAAGACIVNDVYALRAPGARAWAAASEVGVCLMHMQGEPRTMQDSPHYDDVVAEVCEFLARERTACIDAGIAPEAIVLDPGIGFGKGLAHNLTLLKELSRFTALGAPLLVGVSRKSFIGRILGRGVD